MLRTCGIIERNDYAEVSWFDMSLRHGRCIAHVLGLFVGLTSCGPAATVRDDPSKTKAEVRVGNSRGTSLDVRHGPASLCATGEAVFFSCPIGTKQVAVCGAQSGARYRYGSPSRIELEVATVTSVSRGFAGGGETQITASHGDYSYTVYDRTVRTSFDADGRHDPVFSSGLIVRRGGRTISARRCNDEPIMTSDPTEGIGKGSFVEH